MDSVAMVTGAGRGIGLELCRLMIERGDTVVACPRRSGSFELEALAEEHPDRLFRVPMDVREVASVNSAAAQIGRRVERIDLLFNNGAIYPDEDGGLERLDMDDLLAAFDVNALGPLRVVRAFLPLLRKGQGRRVIQITSLMGSIEDNSSGGSYAYRMSKAALNMAVRNLAHELGPEGFICLAIHPGWVKTRMGGAAAPLEVRDASAEVLGVALGAGADDGGKIKGPGGTTFRY